MESWTDFDSSEEEKKLLEFSEEAYANEIKNEPLEVLKDKLIDVNERIVVDNDNKVKKTTAPFNGVDLNTVAPEIKNAEQVLANDEKRREILERTIRQKKQDSKPKIRGQFGSFFGF